MAKRSNGEGSIRQRSDGRWEARLTMPDGKQRSCYAKTKAEVIKKLRQMERSVEDGVPIGDARTTLDSYLQAWLESARPALRVRTWERYESLIRLHARPVLGRLKLKAVTPTHLRQLYAAKLEEGLSPRTVGHLHRVLHRAHGQAEKDGLIARNPASAVSPPRVQHAEMSVLDASQVRQLFDAARGHRFETLINTAVLTGARLGELLGMKWSDLNLSEGTWQVQRQLQETKDGKVAFEQPKTKRSRRQVILTRQAVESLRQHRVRQLEERVARADVWQDQDLVFPNEIGGPYRPSNLRSRIWLPIREKAGVPAVRFHDLRHTYATLMFGQGVHPKVVQEQLGHANVSITLDTYSHAVPSLQRGAADKLDALLASG